MTATGNQRTRRRITNAMQRFAPVIRYFMSNLLGAFKMDMSILEDYLKLMPLSDRRRLVKTVSSYKGKEEIDYAELMNCNLSSPNSIADTIDDMWRDKQCKLSAVATMKILIDIWDGTPRYSEQVSAYPRQFEQLKSVFRFDDKDLSILALLYFYKHSSILDNIFNNGRTSLSNDLAARAAGLPLHELMKRTKPQGSIGSSGLLENSNAQQFTEKGLIDQVQQIFFTKNMDLKLGLFSSRDTGERFSLESFSIPGQDIKILSRLLSSAVPAHILFHGKPGTGKTELARSLAGESGRKVFILNMPVDDNTETKRAALLMGIIQAEREQAVLIADEMDFLLNTESLFKIDGIDKAWIITVMEAYKAHVVWISNSISAVHKAVLRRFNFSMEFKTKSASHRLKEWHSVIKSSPAGHLISDEMAADFAGRYEAPPGLIAIALKSLKSIAGRKKMSEAVVRETLDTLLKRHMSLTGGKISPVKSGESRYELSALNTSTPVERLITAAEGFRDGRINRGISTLLYGLSGTGKSAFVKHVAETSGLPLITRRSSDLLSKYVGETEINIRDAFQEAEESNSILLIDEVDTFLADRNDARNSWERTQVNELLTCMEEFNGLFFCTTNLKEILDAAVMRRFTFKVEFHPLDREGRMTLFRKYFPECSLDTEDRETVKRLDSLLQLTPGDFKAASERLLFSGIDKPAIEEAIHELEEEVKEKQGGISRPVGFSGAA